MKFFLNNYFLLLLALSFFSCGWDKAEPLIVKSVNPCDTVAVVSFSRDIQPIFSAHCINAGCHSGSSPAGNLNLEPSVAYSQLMKAGSGYIDTINPNYSLLYSQMNSVSQPMPPSGKLDDCTLNLVLKWIQQEANVSTVGSAPTNTTTTNPKGTLIFHLHTYIDANEVDAYNITYSTAEGRSLSLSLAQFYLSDIQLEKADGSFYNVANKNLLKILEADTYVVGDIPVGTYKSIRFKVGLGPATNAESPTTSADANILNRSEMWFSSNAQPDGYVFFNAQGSIDTSYDMSGKMAPFIYKIGTNANYKQVTMPVQSHTIIANQAEYVHMYVDYGLLFSGITLDNAHLSITTTVDNNSTLATQIVNNISSMFRYE